MKDHSQTASDNAAARVIAGDVGRTLAAIVELMQQFETGLADQHDLLQQPIDAQSLEASRRSFLNNIGGLMHVASSVRQQMQPLVERLAAVEKHGPGAVK